MIGNMEHEIEGILHNHISGRKETKAVCLAVCLTARPSPRVIPSSPQIIFCSGDHEYKKALRAGAKPHDRHLPPLLPNTVETREGSPILSPKFSSLPDVSPSVAEDHPSIPKDTPLSSSLRTSKQPADALLSYPNHNNANVEVTNRSGDHLQLRELHNAEAMDREGDGECNPYEGGHEWCHNAVSHAERKALEIHGTNMYCSRDCVEHGGEAV